MKTTIQIIASIAAAITLRADPVTVTLPVPVTVTETTTTKIDTASPEIECILIDLRAKEVGIKLAGIDPRVVVSGGAYDAVMDPNIQTLLSAVKAALSAALLPQPTPTPEP